MAGVILLLVLGDGSGALIIWGDRRRPCPKWPGKAAVLRSQPDAKSLILYEQSGARGIRTLDTA
jgi:hypothetical protein